MSSVANEMYPKMEWSSSSDIPSKASEESVSIDSETDSPDDAADLKTSSVEESSDKEHWLTIAIAYCNQGRTSQGIRSIESASDVFEGAGKASSHTFSTWAHLKLAKESTTSAETREHELTQAEVHLRDAIGYDPTWVGNMLATVDSYYERGNYDKALETCDSFVKSIYAEDKRTGRISKPNAMFISSRAKSMYQKKNYVASSKLFQESSVINPVLKPDPRIGIGMCFWQSKDYKLAIQAWERASQLDPNNKQASISVSLGKFHNSLTEAENDEDFKEKYAAALADLNTVYTNSKESPVSLVSLQTFFFFKGDYEKVITIHDQKISKLSFLAPESVYSESLFWCGRASYAMGDYRKAFTMFQESLKRDENNSLARLGSGQTQIKNSSVEESILTFESLYKANENVQESNYILGMSYTAKCIADPAKNNDSTGNKQKNLTGAESVKMIGKALHFLDRYIKLTAAKKNQMTVPRVHLVMSQLYESQSQYHLALESLEKAIENIKFFDGENGVPLEVLNNLSCLYFITGDYEKAQKYLALADGRLSQSSNDGAEKLVLNYNDARILEASDANTALTRYGSISGKHPGHVAAKVRELYSTLEKTGVDNSDEYKRLSEEVENLVESEKDNLEVRAFYSWFLKRSELTGRAVAENNAKESAFNRDTLVKYDSHDKYALISLANLYVTLARDARHSKSSKDQEKSKQSFLKATQLYQKVLQLDPSNVFAAQGIAIMFAESKRMGPALEILRKVRDSLENEDVHVNIAHCLLDMREYVKAIEAYEFVLKKFCTDNSSMNKSRVLNSLARAWYSRGMRERSVQFFQNALEKASAALETESTSNFKNSRFLGVLKYNVALLHFQIAETLRRTGPMLRTSAGMKDALVGLSEALVLLKELLESDNFKTVSKEESEQRIQLGETTMKSALERAVIEQEAFEEDQNKKIEEARIQQAKAGEEEEAKRKKAEEEARAAEEKKNEEFRKLQEEARKLMEERESYMVDEKDVNDLSEEDGDFGGDEPGASPQKKDKKKKAGTKKRKRSESKPGKKASAAGESGSEDEDEAQVTSGRKRKKPALSEEFIADSDEELSSAKMSEDEEAKMSDEEEAKMSAGDDEDDGLF